MKKIFALLLILACAFSIVSCNNGNSGDNETPAANDSGLSVFLGAISNEAPKTAKIVTTETFGEDKLTTEINVTYNADGSFEIAYTTQRFGEIGEDYIVTVPGAASCDKDGNFTALGENGNVVAESIYTLVLEESKLQDAKIEKNTLSAKIYTKDTKAVLGWDLTANADIAVAVSNGKIVTFRVSYNNVVTTCEYTY